MQSPLSSLFQFGTIALYVDANYLSKSCHIFIDEGFSEHYNSYYAQAHELITVISLSLSEIPAPKQGDKIQVDQTIYYIESIQAKDDAIALLRVKKL